MRNVLAVLEKELKSYFVSPIAYVVMAIFLVITGYFFSLILFYSREADLRPLFYNMTVILLIASPALTMRLFAEEMKSGTIELLLTSPVREVEVVVGKYLASALLFLVMLALTLQYPFILYIFGKPDRGPIITGYLGLILLGLSYLSVGVFASTLTKNQIVSALISFGILLLLWFIQASSTFVRYPLNNLVSYLSLSEHYGDFAKGIVDTKDIVYYLSVAIFFLFLSTKSIETRKWR